MWDTKFQNPLQDMAEENDEESFLDKDLKNDEMYFDISETVTQNEVFSSNPEENENSDLQAYVTEQHINGFEDFPFGDTAVVLNYTGLNNDEQEEDAVETAYGVGHDAQADESMHENMSNEDVDTGILNGQDGAPLLFAQLAFEKEIPSYKDTLMERAELQNVNIDEVLRSEAHDSTEIDVLLGNVESLDNYYKADETDLFVDDDENDFKI